VGGKRFGPSDVAGVEGNKFTPTDETGVEDGNDDVGPLDVMGVGGNKLCPTDVAGELPVIATDEARCPEKFEGGSIGVRAETSSGLNTL
jgi:hypothetical protein